MSKPEIVYDLLEPVPIVYVEEPAFRVNVPLDPDLSLRDPQPTAEQRYELFETLVNHWVTALGLRDWYVYTKHSTEPSECEALIEYDRDTRHASITYYSACPDPQPIERVALHEVLHLLFGDVIPEDCGDDVAREEHRVIERLLHVLL
jgi:hypothetical protein